MYRECHVYRATAGMAIGYRLCLGILNYYFLPSSENYCSTVNSCCEVLESDMDRERERETIYSINRVFTINMIVQIVEIKNES